MPPRKGQIKEDTIKPACSDEDRLAVRRLAQGGRFQDTPAYEMLREWEANLESRCAEEVPLLAPDQRAELDEEEKALALKHGMLIGSKILSRDVAFFKELARCLDAYPISDDNYRPAIDHVLDALAQSPKFLGSGPYTISQLMDYLHFWFRLSPDPREIRKKARFCGLKIAAS